MFQSPQRRGGVGHRRHAIHYAKMAMKFQSPQRRGTSKQPGVWFRNPSSFNPLSVGAESVTAEVECDHYDEVNGLQSPQRRGGVGHGTISLRLCTYGMVSSNPLSVGAASVTCSPIMPVSPAVLCFNPLSVGAESVTG